MGIFDKAGDLAKQHEDRIEAGIERAGDFVDEKTGGKYAGQVDQAQDFANEHLDKVTGEDIAPTGDDTPAPNMQ